MAIQAWTGSGVVGPIDVMGPQESPRQGQGELQDWVVAGLGLRRVSDTGLAGWAESQNVGLVSGTSGGKDKADVPFFGWVAGKSQTLSCKLGWPLISGLLVCEASLRHVRQACHACRLRGWANEI